MIQTSEQPQTLTKSERLSRRSQIELLFNGGGSRSATVFPLRVVYRMVPREAHQPAAQVLVSVPKRLLKHAVDRNRVKRQVREAYRKNKQLIQPDSAETTEQTCLLAFIWLDSRLYNTAIVEQRVVSLLEKISSRP